MYSPIKGSARTPMHLIKRIEELAGTTPLSVRRIREELNGTVSRSVVGEIVKWVRDGQEVG